MQEPLVKAKILSPGDTIGIAAPASPFDRQEFERGIAVLESLGFKTKVPEGVFLVDGYLAGADSERAALLMELFRDDSVSAIFCARGGFGSMKVLPLLDFETIGRHPKILVGFSDITTLLLAVYRKSNMIAFHGPLVTTMGKSSEVTSQGLLSAVSSLRPLVLKASTPMVLNPGHASGPVSGGNLTVLTHLVGTPYEPRFKGHIIFLEDRGEAPYRIDRMLSQLQLAGLLDDVAGVILGSFMDCGSKEEVCEIVDKAFANSGIPILAGFDFGHGKENLTVPIGVEADLDTQDGTLRFREPAVVEVSA